MQTKIKTMLKMQNELNIQTCGEDWKSGVCKNGKTIDWSLAITMECAELIDCYDWKWWKSKEVDLNNAKIEIVDIWHFVMSELLIESKDYQSDLKKDICNLFNRKDIKGYYELYYTDNVRDLIFKCFNSDNRVYNSFYILESFIYLLHPLDMDFDELYTLYIGKNTLNKFRQDNGYKDGTYIKMWNEKEDNIFMQNILNEFPNLTPDELYSLLSDEYMEVKNESYPYNL